MTENLPILIGNFLFLISSFLLYMRLLDWISIVNSRQGIVPSKGERANLLHRNRLNLDGTFFTSTVPHLEFSIQFQSNNFFNTSLLRWNDFGCTPLEGTIPCLEFTIEIQSNNLIYNPNKEIRDRVFPVKIGKFSVKYYTFWLIQVVELTHSSKKTLVWKNYPYYYCYF